MISDVGLVALRSRATPKKYKISFNVQRVINNGRKTFSKELRRLFTQNLMKSYGGWVLRLDDSPCTYHVAVFTTSSAEGGALTDDSLNVFYTWANEMLQVEYDDIHVHEISDDSNEVNFMTKFYLFQKESEPEGWSQYGADDASERT